MKMSLGYCYMLLLLFAFIAVVSGEVVDEKKKVGDKALFKPDITAATSLKDRSITWKYAAGSDVIKVIEWDNDFKTLESLNPKFNNSISEVNLDRNTGELTIRKLQLEHTGLYTIEINNKEEEKKFKLTVMEGVPKPELVPEATGNPQDVMYLTCKSKTTFKIRFDCSNGEKQQITNQGVSITFTRAKMQGVCCNCTFSNEVSEETSNSLCEKDLFTDSGNGGIVAGIVIAFILLIILIIPIIIFLCVKSIHDSVYNSCNDIPCVGGIVKFLDARSKFSDETTGQHPASSKTIGKKIETIPSEDRLLDTAT